MDVSSTSAASQLYGQMQNVQRKEPPSASDFASQIMQNSDSDEDSLLDISEIGLDEESFASFDSDGDGSLSSSELEEGIASKLQDMKDSNASPEEFGQFLSSLGLEVPPPPPPMPNTSNMASELFSSKDSDEDGLLSLDELGISEDLFSSMDSDEDGMVSQEELEEKLQSMFEDLKNGDITESDFQETMNELGLTPPPGGQAMSGGGSGGGSSEEEYDDADTNQDGTVSAAEYAAYYGSDDSSDSTEAYTMELLSTLLGALKSESNSNSVEANQFKDIMKMVNNQYHDNSTANDLNTYVSNIS